MTFVSGYRMIFNLLKLVNVMLYNGVVIDNYYSFKNDSVWLRNTIITDCRPTHGTVRKGHKVGIIQALSVQYICIFQVPFPFNVNKLCSDKIRISLDIGQTLLVSKL